MKAQLIAVIISVLLLDLPLVFAANNFVSYSYFMPKDQAWQCTAKNAKFFYAIGSVWNGGRCVCPAGKILVMDSYARCAPVSVTPKPGTCPVKVFKDKQGNTSIDASVPGTCTVKVTKKNGVTKINATPPPHYAPGNAYVEIMPIESKPAPPKENSVNLNALSYLTCRILGNKWFYAEGSILENEKCVCPLETKYAVISGIPTCSRAAYAAETATAAQSENQAALSELTAANCKNQGSRWFYAKESILYNGLCACPFETKLVSQNGALVCDRMAYIQETLIPVQISPTTTAPSGAPPTTCFVGGTRMYQYNTWNCASIPMQNMHCAKVDTNPTHHYIKNSERVFMGSVRYIELKGACLPGICSASNTMHDWRAGIASNTSCAYAKDMVTGQELELCSSEGGRKALKDLFLGLLFIGCVGISALLLVQPMIDTVKGG